MQRSEQQMPARIWCDEIDASLCKEKPERIPHYAYYRSDIAERMAEALERSLSWLTSYPGGGALGAYEQARSALSAFRSATQDTEARHD